MKIEEQFSEVESSGDFEESAFRIEASAKMFEILFDKIYSDKIASVVREIGSNALDSHTKAGRPEVPFEIHVPTSMEPWFSVKDYGVGLSTEEVRDIYTVMTKSTKTNSNDEIGGFGLGSKTPFAYNDAFTVICVKDGVKVEYAMYKNAHGVPAFSPITTSETPSGDVIIGEETDEPNGVEVKIPVRTSDIAYFGTCIQKTFCSFNVLPTIVNPRPGFRIAKMIWESTSEKSKVYTYTFDGDNGYYANILVKLGPIIYPVDLGKIFQTLPVARSSQFQSLAGSRLLLEFGIGELNITVSREQLAYDKTTCEKIVSRIQSVFDESMAEIDAEIAKSKNIIEAKRTFAKMSAGDPKFLPLTNTILKQRWHNPLFNGESCNSIRHEVSITDKEDFVLHIVAGRSLQAQNLYHVKYVNTYNAVTGRNESTPVKDWYINPIVVDSTFVHENEDRLNAANRASYLHERTGGGTYRSNHTVYVIRPADHVTGKDRYERALKAFLAKIPVGAVVKMSDLPKRESPKVEKTKNLQLSRFDHNYKRQPNRSYWGRRNQPVQTSYSSNCWPKGVVVLDAKSKYFFVRVNGFNVMENTDYENPVIKYGLKEMVEVAVKMGLVAKDVIIYAIRKDDQECMQTGEWVEFLSFAQAHVDKEVKANGKLISMIDLVTTTEENLQHNRFGAIFNRLVTCMPKEWVEAAAHGTTKFEQVLTDAAFVNSSMGNTKRKIELQNLRDLARLLDSEFDPKDSEAKIITDRIEEALKRYPLLKNVSMYNVQKTNKEIINMIVEYAVAMDEYLGE